MDWLHVEKFPKGMRRYFRVSCGKDPLGYSCTIWLWFWKFSWFWVCVPPVYWLRKAVHIVYHCWRDARGLPVFPTYREAMGGKEPHRCLLCGRLEMPWSWMPVGYPDRWGHRVFNPNRKRPDPVCAHHKEWFSADIVDWDTNITIPSDDLSAKSLYCLDVLGDELTYWIRAVAGTAVLLARRWRCFFRKNLPITW